MIFANDLKGNLYNPRSKKIKFIVEGKACGKLTGGNLSIICSSLGTDNEIDTNNKILFIEEIAEEIEKKISNNMLTEIESEKIGEMVMKRLKEIDEISYVRFASVYRQFKDINTFLEEITRLMIK